MKTIISAIKYWVDNKVDDKIVDSTANWNQNDSTASDYVKNRTHWEEDNRTSIILDTQSIGGFENNSDVFYTLFQDIQLEKGIELELGKVYSVLWDSIEYKTELREDEAG
jgi:hypothetical protein